MGGYPVILKLEGIRCVVIGGGAVAERKTAGLLDAGADIVIVVSPSLTLQLRKLAESGRITAEIKEYEQSDIRGAGLVFAATDSREVNARVASDAARAGVMVNTADEGSGGSFITPAVVRRGDLLLAVTTSGASPALAAHIRQELEHRYGPRYEAALRDLKRLREELKKLVPDAVKRKELLREAAQRMNAELTASEVHAVRERNPGDADVEQH
ncbi:precorrin-2 dehydrogenase/sirohydrochlorin ferrochelatase family protein [Paenibacillus beijingensis]|uniref:precorrin-2 dehydrogenase n=1 Tax=Paenibacillus beijingensis TaxID=1126833 RepID=A0A0D5NM19_9BACL|nr:bifunctional precorrin-2 dehydrogenase/sirohydrochlorin ferrochelatase [Paenibacillus beijingensis]AJY76047.1 hypothetical protein VN24_17655 [Paenibacillus beijingensis]